jgi:hypothetical protein
MPMMAAIPTPADPTSVCDLAPFRDASFDLVYAIDSFPYVVLADPGLVQEMLSESGRVFPARWFLVRLELFLSRR